ncbi:DoxX family protein [Microvirga sp. BT688]|uniref:DoxX family protein n=1 Tax=Microvirga sp. TaxID=1873136 RepID=UPI00168530F4|nr:DoxX family protein [Microvirga sp.]MBD2747444.1 DoxX family protein [Microvirga sp.]
MTTISHAATAGAAPTSSGLVWTGRALSGLVVLFLLFDGTIKLVPLQVAIDTVIPLGWPTDPVTWRALGIVLIVSTLLYAYPRTAFLGALLITAYLGGAVATHVRVGSPLFSHSLFGVYMGIALWTGLWLRDPRIRALLR